MTTDLQLASGTTLPTQVRPSALQAMRSRQAVATVVSASRHEDLTLRSASNRLVQISPVRYELRGPLSDVERATLDRRAAYLDDRMSPASPAVIIEEVANLRLVLGATPLTGDAREKLVEAFLRDLGRYPEWVVRDACAYFRRKGGFCPDSGQVRARCDEIAAPHFAELIRIDRLLNAETTPVFTEEQQEKNRAKVAQIYSEFMKRNVTVRNTEDQAA